MKSMRLSKLEQTRYRWICSFSIIAMVALVLAFRFQPEGWTLVLIFVGFAVAGSFGLVFGFGLKNDMRIVDNWKPD